MSLIRAVTSAGRRGVHQLRLLPGRAARAARGAIDRLSKPRGATSLSPLIGAGQKVAGFPRFGAPSGSDNLYYRPLTRPHYRRSELAFQLTSQSMVRSRKPPEMARNRSEEQDA